jgi:hypothetical protein
MIIPADKFAGNRRPYLLKMCLLAKQPKLSSKKAEECAKNRRRGIKLFHLNAT